MNYYNQEALLITKKTIGKIMHNKSNTTPKNTAQIVQYLACSL